MPLITKEIASFLEGPNSTIAAAHSGDLVPELSRVFFLRCVPGGRRLTAILAASSERLLAHLRTDGRIAISAELPASHKTMQVKGRAVGFRDVAEAERPEVERAVAAFFDACEAVGLPRRLMDRLSRWPLVAVDVEVAELFDQSPGPGAGASIAKARARRA